MFSCGNELLTNGEELNKQQRVTDVSLKFGELRSTNGRDLFVSFDLPSERFRTFFFHIEVTE